MEKSLAVTIEVVVVGSGSAEVPMAIKLSFCSVCIRAGIILTVEEAEVNASEPSGNGDVE